MGHSFGPPLGWHAPCRDPLFLRKVAYRVFHASLVRCTFRDRLSIGVFYLLYVAPFVAALIYRRRDERIWLQLANRVASPDTPGNKPVDPTVAVVYKQGPSQVTHKGKHHIGKEHEGNQRDLHKDV